jgi:type IV pilus assembly protein PilA
VILIIGILAAIAIPSFLNQKTKANDAQAKELARTAQTAAETSATDNNGSYTGVTTTNLNSIEPTLYLTSTAANGGAFLSSATGNANTYTVVATSSNGNTYTISRASDGTVSRACTAGTAPNSGGCVNSKW